MPRSYRHIKEYELELNRLKEEGLSENQIGENLGFSFKQVHNFFNWDNNNIKLFLSQNRKRTYEEA